jgi:hypothetical protein
MNTLIVRTKKIRKQRPWSSADQLDLYSPDIAAAAAEPAGGMVQGSRDRKPARRRAQADGAWLCCERGKQVAASRQAKGGS